MWVAITINGTACWTTLLLWDFKLCEKKKKSALYKYSKYENIYHINFSNISKTPNVDQIVHNCFEKISYLYNLIQFSTRRYTHIVGNPRLISSTT